MGHHKIHYASSKIHIDNKKVIGHENVTQNIDLQKRPLRDGSYKIHYASNKLHIR